VGGAYAALAYNGATLYGLNLGPSPALDTHLVTIDPTTGAVTDLGQSVAALDAIAFTPIPEPATLSMLLVPAVIGLLRNRKR
jgi:hypothetical protein